MHTPRSSANGMNHTCFFLPSRSWSSFADPGGMEGWVGLGDWLHIEISVRHRKLNPDTVTHLSTNRDRCRLTFRGPGTQSHRILAHFNRWTYQVVPIQGSHKATQLPTSIPKAVWQRKAKHPFHAGGNMRGTSTQRGGETAAVDWHWFSTNANCSQLFVSFARLLALKRECQVIQPMHHATMLVATTTSRCMICRVYMDQTNVFQRIEVE